MIAGISGTEPTAEELALLRDYPVAGFILFQRNCHDLGQLCALTRQLKDIYSDRWVPILIDHEGGRVQRMKPPAWRLRPAARRLGDLPAHQRRKAARIWAGLLAADLTAVGIDVNCVPVMDVARPETTGAIGDRAFSREPAIVAELGRITIETMLEAGVAPVMKHLPGHGRARVDTHLELPCLSESVEELALSDLVPFCACADKAPFAMTAHIVFEKVDPKRPATQSRLVISEIIRGRIGFSGILFSDDLSMEALDGTIEERAFLALSAGCDLVLHCNGRFEELSRLLPAMPHLSAERLACLEAARPKPATGVIDRDAAAAELDHLLAAT